MARVTPDQATEKWASRLGGATQEIRNGVAGVTVAPGMQAAKQKDLWLMRLQQSADKWARRVGAVSLQEWQTAMVEKGIPRIASGANAAKPKVASFMAEFLPYVDQGVAKVKAMPKGDLSSSAARMLAMMQHNASFKRQSK